ncbi:uncharacterized protein LOC113959349 [Corapipo altera]|uniref:uncharacterized protein LOC113959349 n=1 Tax=Corapipo altera TaxID=415028 RepID=UPI000FD62454|nr:uncharacterized protein LOC113959349 [Corapipo altera]
MVGHPCAESPGQACAAPSVSASVPAAVARSRCSAVMLVLGPAGALLPSRGRAVRGEPRDLPPSSSARLLLSLPSLSSAAPPPAPQTLLPSSACARRCGEGDTLGGLRAVFGGLYPDVALLAGHWLSGGSSSVALGEAETLSGAEQLGEPPCASPGSSCLCLRAAGAGREFRHLPVACAGPVLALVARMSPRAWHSPDPAALASGQELRDPSGWALGWVLQTRRCRLSGPGSRSRVRLLSRGKVSWELTASPGCVSCTRRSCRRAPLPVGYAGVPWSRDPPGGAGVRPLRVGAVGRAQHRD